MVQRYNLPKNGNSLSCVYEIPAPTPTAPALQFDQKPLFTVFFRVFSIARLLRGVTDTMAKNTSPEVTGIAGLKFEAALAELEKLVASMEAGQLPLEESLTAYRRGVSLLQHCQNQLADAEEKVRVLDNGKLRPLDSSNGDAP